MKNVVKPWIDANYSGVKYCGSKMGLLAKIVQEWCKKNLVEFWLSNMWPPSSPDLAPLDYGIWGEMEKKACALKA